ncbi:PepSY domain-containing protein [Agrococcus lahaulensis]|uniref:PepSY domain-containing protein n=1 Tax=Agrococcus lahaulensis TaxID=341722 RepID=UPI0005545090|nr:PepSY domain-containing protein [Agrococcus lahaulensis]
MKNLKKKAAVTGIIATTLAFGGAGLAMAANPDSTQPSSSATDEQDPSYTGSVQAPQDAMAPDGSDTELSEAEEAASLQGLATVTPEEATAAALAAVPGTAGDAVLEDENGYVLYEVQVTEADGSVIDVKVDAGDASVLAQEADEPEGTDEATENGSEQDETGENGAEDPNS